MNIEKRQSMEKKDNSDDWRSLGAKLAEIWKIQNPDIERTTSETVDRQREDLERRENAIADMEVQEVLEKFGFDIRELEYHKQIDIDGGPEDIYILRVREHFWDQRLPEGYGYSGGAARALLMRNLGIDPSYVPRDVDVVRMVSEEPYAGADAEIAKQYMPEDLEHGHGVRNESYYEHYFNSRDLTINQVIATDEEIYVSRIGLLDSARCIIRLTNLEKIKLAGGKGQKMLAKVLRFYVEMINRYGDATIKGVEDHVIEDLFVKSFYFALQLDKAMQISDELAQNYVAELKRRGRLPEEIESVEDAADYLIEDTHTFYYRYAPEEQFELEEHWTEDYERVPKQRGHGASRGKK